MNTRRTGFTLVEILVVVLIIAVLAGVLIPVISNSLKTGKRATCLMNLHQIGMAIIAYRQDTNTYPEPGKAIGALSSAYGKLLPKDPNCPRDPDKNHATYEDLYNYWGYDSTLTPTPIEGTPWGAGVDYQSGDTVINPDMPYICKAPHTSSSANEPGKGSSWTDYWINYPEKVYGGITGSGYLWRVTTNTSTPDSDFPGLVNPAAPPNTIVTICPQHVNDIHNLLVLRVSGDAGTVPQQKTDKEFWALSKMP